MKKDFKDKISHIWDLIKRFCINILNQLKDKQNLIIFVIVVVVMSSEIWLFFLLGTLFNSKALLAAAAVCWAFWAGPATPFFPLCVAIALAVRKILDKLGITKKISDKGSDKNK